MDTELTLEQRLLVRVAKQLSYELDQVDIVSNPTTINVRDLVIEFTKDNRTRPVDVRMALSSLMERGLLRGSGGELRSPQETVGLSMRGLLAAREIKPGCGLPARVVTLVMERGGRAGVFGATIKTGNKEQDALLDASGLNLAAFYVLAAKRPTMDRPLMRRDCELLFSRLAALGVGPRSGKGARVLPTLESVSKAFDTIKLVVPLAELSDEDDARDGREVGWYLAGEFPEVHVEGASGNQLRDWTWMQFNLTCAIDGKPFVDGAHDLQQPLTDQQVNGLRELRELEKEQRREAQSNKPREPRFERVPSRGRRRLPRLDDDESAGDGDDSR